MRTLDDTHRDKMKINYGNANIVVLGNIFEGFNMEFETHCGPRVCDDFVE